MSKTRLELDAELKKICPTVYFQEPRSERMEYPCIKYALNKISTENANNHIYKLDKHYTVTYITKDPDDPIIEGLLHAFPGIKWDRQYKSSNLYHNVYELEF